MKTTLVDSAELAANPRWRVFDCRHDLAPAIVQDVLRSIRQLSRKS